MSSSHLPRHRPPTPPLSTNPSCLKTSCATPPLPESHESTTEKSYNGPDNLSPGIDEKTWPNGKIGDSESAQCLYPDDDFPDGGWRAWTILFGTVCSCTSSFGFINSWGVFQAYYQETLLRDYSPSTIAWIGSIQYSLIFFPGLIVGRLFDIGYFKTVFWSSNAILLLATFLTAQCTQYWHFLLCQGIVIGVVSSGLYGCSNAIIAHWFKRFRGRAIGLMSAGTAIGGAVFPIVAKKLIPIVGFPWTIRIIGFILILTTGTSVLTLKRRLPPVNVKGGLFNFAVFKEARFSVYTLSSFLIFLGIYTVLTYVSVSARELGTAPDLAFYFVAFSNASSLFGRATAGILADRFGPMNVMIPSITISAILTYIWPFTRSTASLIVVTVIYGWCCGSYTCLIANPVMNFGREGDVGRRVGMYLSVISIGALAGPPIAGAINARTGGFEAMGIYAGTAMISGAWCMVIVRYLVLRQWTGRL